MWLSIAEREWERNTFLLDKTGEKSREKEAWKKPQSTDFSGAKKRKVRKNFLSSEKGYSL